MKAGNTRGNAGAFGYAQARSCVLQQFGDKDFLALAPGEFRIVDSVKLDADEKLNAE